MKDCKQCYGTFALPRAPQRAAAQVHVRARPCVAWLYEVDPCAGKPPYPRAFAAPPVSSRVECYRQNVLQSALSAILNEISISSSAKSTGCAQRMRISSCEAEYPVAAISCAKRCMI